MGKENGLAPEPRRPASLTERLEAEAARARAAENEVPAPASMAERFAPEAAPGANALQARGTADASAFPRTLLAAIGALAFLPSLALGALYFRDEIGLDYWIPAPPGLAVTQASAPSPAPASLASVAPTETILPKMDIERPHVAVSLAGVIEADAGKQAPFPIAIDSTNGLPLRSILSIRGLPEGAVFSAGRPYGGTEWSLRPDEIGDLALALPEGAGGEHELSVALIAADGTVLANGATRLVIAPDPKAALIVRPDDKARIAELIAHGQKMIDVGYIAGARGYFKRAAEAGSAEAALRVGDTYDPVFIASIGAQGIRPDEGEARSWYQRAKTLGSPDADARLAGRAEVAATSVPQQSEPEQAAQDLAPVAPQPASGTEWVEIASAVNVRAEPTPEAETLQIAQRGMRFKATARKGRWVQVTDPDTAEVGWVYSRFIAGSGTP